MKKGVWIERLIVVCFLFLACSYSIAESLSDFTKRCEREVGVDEIPGFDCRDGIHLYNNLFGTYCDSAPKLGGVGCTSNKDGHRFGKLDLGNDDVDAVFLCRKYQGLTGHTPTDNNYNDIAMIVHNRKNGKTCFFQNDQELAKTGMSGVMPSPKTNTGNKWFQPEVLVSENNCSACHRNDPFIVTPHVADAFRFFHLLRDSKPKGPYSFVGPDFWRYKTEQKEGGCAGSCHFDFADNEVLSLQNASIVEEWMPPRSGSPWDTPFYNKKMDWVSTDSADASGDHESHKRVVRIDPRKTCERPQAFFYARRKDSSREYVSRTLNVLKTFNAKDGVVCINEDQPSGKCANHKVRYMCNGSWTKWYDRDTPNAFGDWEGRKNHAGVCSAPTRIQARVDNGYRNGTYEGLPDRPKVFSAKDGLVCKNADQPDGKCHDYEVAWRCSN